MKPVETNSDADLLTTLLKSLQLKGRCLCYSEAARAWIQGLPESERGWLGALRDKQIF
jgi:hypothetical protein